MATETGRSPAEAGSGCQPSASAADASSRSGIPNAVLAVMADVGGFPADFAGNVLASIAVSLRRIADMMEEANRPQIRLMEEGEISETERRRRLLAGMEKDVANGARIAAALEAMATQAIKGGAA